MTSLLSYPYPRFLRSLYERIAGVIGIGSAFQNLKAGETSSTVGVSAFHWPDGEQQFSSFAGTEYISVLPWPVDFELHTFAPALVVHGPVTPRREA